jgi:hypothetical protein
MNAQDFQNLIAKGKTLEAMNELRVVDVELSPEIGVLIAKIEKFNKEKMLGIIDYTQQNIEFNVINFTAMQLIDKAKFSNELDKAIQDAISKINN